MTERVPFPDARVLEESPWTESKRELIPSSVTLRRTDGMATVRYWIWEARVGLAEMEMRQREIYGRQLPTFGDPELSALADQLIPLLARLESAVIAHDQGVR